MDEFTNELKTNFSKCTASPSRILHYSLTDSTNERARRFPGERCADAEIALCGNEGVALFVADCQSQGRGRLQRRFVSNAGAGLYMSIKFPYHGELSDAVGITPLAAVSVCRAIEQLCDARPSVKWVNDVHLGGKKLAGILTESIVSESGEREFICGIGVNLVPSDMPEELREIATNLLSEGYSVNRAKLCTKITEEFLLGLEKIWDRETVEEYKARSFTVGKNVTVSNGNESYRATVTEITDRYELVVKLPDGTQRTLSSGEVSLKMQS